MGSLDDYIDELLAELQTPEPVQSVVHNIINEPIPESVKRRLLEPLLPGATRPSPPSRKAKERKRKAILEEFDPVPQQKIRTVQDYQNEVLQVFF